MNWPQLVGTVAVAAGVSFVVSKLAMRGHEAEHHERRTQSPEDIRVRQLLASTEPVFDGLPQANPSPSAARSPVLRSVLQALLENC